MHATVSPPTQSGCGFKSSRSKIRSQLHMSSSLTEDEGGQFSQHIFIPALSQRLSQLSHSSSDRVRYQQLRTACHAPKSDNNTPSWLTTNSIHTPDVSRVKCPLRRKSGFGWYHAHIGYLLLKTGAFFMTGKALKKFVALLFSTTSSYGVLSFNSDEGMFKLHSIWIKRIFSALSFVGTEKLKSWKLPKFPSPLAILPLIFSHFHCLICFKARFASGFRHAYFLFSLFLFVFNIGNGCPAHSYRIFYLHFTMSKN